METIIENLTAPIPAWFFLLVLFGLVAEIRRIEKSHNRLSWKVHRMLKGDFSE